MKMTSKGQMKKIREKEREKIIEAKCTINNMLFLHLFSFPLNVMIGY